MQELTLLRFRREGGSLRFNFVLLFIILAAILPIQRIATADQVTARWISYLTEQGWESDAAQAVIELNQSRLADLLEDNPKELDNQLQRLAQLGNYPQLAPLLVKHPETAGLLAGSEDPRLLARTLADEECYAYAAQQYVLLSAPDDALALAHALERYGELACALGKQGILGSVSVFMFPQDTAAGREYAYWLRETMRAKLSASDADLSQFFTLLVLRGNDIRQRMERDERFRETFRRELWPKLTRTVQGEKLDLAVAEPQIWDLLALPEGESILRDWGAEVPIALLFGELAYPQELRQQVLAALRIGDRQTVDALMRFAGEPAFHEFLGRHLPDEITARALSKLSSEVCMGYPDEPCPRLKATLQRYNQLSSQALAEELGPASEGLKTWLPLYYTYYTAKKLAQGREIDPSDIAFLAMDVFSIVPIGRFVETATKTGVKVTVEQLGRTGVRQSLKDLTQEQLAKAIGKEMSKRMAAKNLLPSALRNVIAKARAAIRHSTALDVTVPVKYVFEKTGIGRETFKRITHLEARVFMRNDGTVVIYPSHYGGKLLWQVAQNGLGDESARLVEKTFGTETDAWQQYASAWWLLNATNLAGEPPG